MDILIGGIALCLLIAFVVAQARQAAPCLEPDLLPGGRDEEPSGVMAGRQPWASPS